MIKDKYLDIFLTDCTFLEEISFQLLLFFLIFNIRKVFRQFFYV